MASEKSTPPAPLQLDPRCTALPFTSAGPVIVLADETVMTIDGQATKVSHDDGETWSEPRPFDETPRPGTPNDSGALLRTREGTLVLVYMDMNSIRWHWDDSERRAAEAALDVWATRSRDGGKSWEDRQKILDGYCGALIDIIQTSSGRIVVPVQDMRHDPSRHVMYSYSSDDEGKSWTRSHMIDLGGRGHHDGAMEPTLAELTDGRVWMLIRTNWDRFWEAISDDGGLSWRTIRPTTIDASSAPGFVLRLQSGRLALVWNRLTTEDGAEPRRHGGDGNTCLDPASWQREELALAVSNDNGQSWTRPVIVARRAGGGLSYPYAVERRPGELWITTRFSDKIALRLRESEFV